jgi:hypothetical protein
MDKELNVIKRIENNLATLDTDDQKERVLRYVCQRQEDRTRRNRMNNNIEHPANVDVPDPPQPPPNFAG